MGKKIKISMIIMFIMMLTSITVSAATLINSKEVIYDNSKSGLKSTNVQAAVDELYSAATDYSSLEQRISKLESSFLDKTYPVGSIYISTTDSTIEQVKKRFGGTWERYGDGRVLRSTSGSSGVTGGNYNVSLTVNNLPTHTHVIPQLDVSAWSGNHGHSGLNGLSFLYFGGAIGETNAGFAAGSLWNGAYKARNQYVNETNITVSGQKTTASNTTTCTNCNGTAFNIENPYITVYMYKRVK